MVCDPILPRYTLNQDPGSALGGLLMRVVQGAGGGGGGRKAQSPLPKINRQKLPRGLPWPKSVQDYKSHMASVNSATLFMCCL